MTEMARYGTPIKLKVPESNPSQPDRINAVNRACRDQDAEVRLEIDPSCRELIADLDGVLRDARGGIKEPTTPRTQTSGALTHPTPGVLGQLRRPGSTITNSTIRRDRDQANILQNRA